MKIPTKLNDKSSALINNPFKQQTVELFNQLIDCIKELEEKNKKLEHKIFMIKYKQ